MNWNLLSEALAQYLCIIVVITLHEFGHAWMSSRCGDDTARLLGRVTLNPIAHMDLLGTVILPLLAVLLSLSGSGLAGFIIGWGKPVPVDYRNLRNVDRDSLLVAMAGPAMNVVLTVVVMILVRLTFVVHTPAIGEAGIMLARLSMVLFFFNLIPVPPLDGSHIMRYLTRMSWETFWNISRYGFLIVVVLIQLPAVRLYLQLGTAYSLWAMTKLLAF